jgi:T-complex protein 1 subunit beta
VLSETVKDSRVVYGGGWPEMRMARAVEEAAKTTPGARRFGGAGGARLRRFAGGLPIPR